MLHNEIMTLEIANILETPGARFLIPVPVEYLEWRGGIRDSDSGAFRLPVFYGMELVIGMQFRVQEKLWDLVLFDKSVRAIPNGVILYVADLLTFQEVIGKTRNLYNTFPWYSNNMDIPDIIEEHYKKMGGVVID